MIETTFTSGKRHGRVFARDDGGDRRGRYAFFDDDDDRSRDRMIARLIRARPIVTAVAHPSLRDANEAHVFLASPDPRARLPRIFACVVVSRSRLAEMLNEGHEVVEGFTLQVADSATLDRQALQRALWRWFRRAYPLARGLRAIRVEVYADPKHTPPTPRRPPGRPRFADAEQRVTPSARIFNSLAA